MRREKRLTLSAVKGNSTFAGARAENLRQTSFLVSWQYQLDIQDETSMCEANCEAAGGLSNDVHVQRDSSSISTRAMERGEEHR